jgi:hypothetical protein
MAFKYNHKDAQKCFPEGDYEAIIKDATEGVSKSTGDPMLTVAFTIFNGADEMILSDYIVAKTTFKLKKIARAVGQLEAFEADTFDVSAFVGHGLVLGLTVETSEKYGDQNRIKDYKVLDRGASGKPVTVTPTDTPSSLRGGAPEIKADDIPFDSGPLGS